MRCQHGGTEESPCADGGPLFRVSEFTSGDVTSWCREVCRAHVGITVTSVLESFAASALVDLVERELGERP